MDRLTDEQNAAIDSVVAGGLSDYIARIRADHGPAFRRGEAGKLYAYCKCGEVGCPKHFFLAHIDRCIAAYEAKVQDFAAEAKRNGAWRALINGGPCPTCKGTGRDDSLDAALAHAYTGIDSRCEACDGEGRAGGLIERLDDLASAMGPEDYGFTAVCGLLADLRAVIPSEGAQK